MLKLIEPSAIYKDSYLSAIAEFQNSDDPYFSRHQQYKNYDLNRIKDDFESYILKPFRDLSNGEALPYGYVPQSEYWLIDGDVYCGAIHIRHALTEKLINEGGNFGYEIRPSKRHMGYATRAILLGFEKAQHLGVNKILIVCNEKNIPSLKTIKKIPYGVKAEAYVTQDGRRIVRYWFDLTPQGGQEEI